MIIKNSVWRNFKLIYIESDLLYRCFEEMLQNIEKSIEIGGILL